MFIIGFPIMIAKYGLPNNYLDGLRPGDNLLPNTILLINIHTPSQTILFLLP
jgi:hypothetical protein